jgi:hypothetical protein
VLVLPVYGSAINGLRRNEKCLLTNKTKTNSVALVRKPTMQTERSPLVGEVSANFGG